MIDGFFKPVNANLADCMPFYHNGEFFIYYLRSTRTEAGERDGVPWALVRSRDLFHFEDDGIVLPNSGKDDQEYFLYTGWVLEKDGNYHLFYVAHNPDFPDKGFARQGIRHAVSTDLYKWTKIQKDDFFSPGGQYERDDWRDPFVFWNEDDACYWMVFAAKHSTGLPKGRGFVALAKSTDLEKWELQPPLYDPCRYEVLECPDLFKIGEWWYLVFSEYSDEFMTRYRMSRSPLGPWIEPKEDTFDGRAFYAARSCADGHDRYLFGWNPTRCGRDDLGSWEFGGTLICHKLVQRKDGTLGLAAPGALAGAFQDITDVAVGKSLGDVHISENEIRLRSRASYACLEMGRMPERGCISFDYESDDTCGGFGLWIYGTEDFEKGYYLRIDADERRICLDHWPRNHETGILARDVNPYILGLYQKLEERECKRGHVDFYFDQTAGIAYVSDGSALTVRMYHTESRCWGLFSRNSNVAFSHVTIRGITGNR